jgi:uncharacterized protein YbjT (DUF2867 family)
MNHAQLLRANKLQEDLIKASLLPYSILRSTQFFEFIAGVVQDGSRSDVVIPPAFIQPVSGLDVAEALADIVTGKPQNRIVELAVRPGERGPRRCSYREASVRRLAAREPTALRAPFGIAGDRRPLEPPGPRSQLLVSRRLSPGPLPCL